MVHKIIFIFLHLGKTVLQKVQDEGENYQTFSQKVTITKKTLENLSKSDKDKVLKIKCFSFSLNNKKYQRMKMDRILLKNFRTIL